MNLEEEGAVAGEGSSECSLSLLPCLHEAKVSPLLCCLALRQPSLVIPFCSHLQFLKNGIPYMNEEQEKKIKHSILRGNWRVRR